MDASPLQRLRGGLAFLLVPVAALALWDALGREGVRLGGWRPEPLAPGALFAGAILLGVLGLLRLRPRAHAAGALALDLLLLSAALATVAATRPRPGVDGPALHGRVWALSGGDESGRDVGGLRLAQLRTPAGLAEACGRRGDLGLELRGFLELPEDGAYRFELDCAGRCALWLGEHELLAGSGRVEARVALSAGVQPLRVTLEQPDARASLALDWDRPAFVETEPLAEAVSPAPPAAGASAARARRVLGRALLQAVALLAAALLALRLGAAARAALPAAPAALRRRRRDGLTLPAAGLGLLTLLLLAGLHAWSAPRALPGGSLHAWTSEYMMQTVSAADLRDEPLRSLFYLHIQPPLFDALRAVLAAGLRSADDAALLRGVDRGLYACWALCCGLGVGLVYAWLAQLAGSRAALLGAVLFALHPATLFYATFLDSTLPSALLVLWLAYELWRIGPGRGSPTRLCLAVLALFFTRALVQWPFLPLLALALWLRGCERGRILRVLSVLTLVMGLYLAKQYALFGLTITSSFGPDSFCKGLSAYCQGTTPVELPHALPPPGAASVLRRTAKLNGEYNYNQLAFLRRSFAQLVEYRELLRGLSAEQLVRLMAHNLGLWLRPSSRHSPHVLVDALPWRRPFDFVMSGWPLVLLLALASGRWLRQAWRSGPVLRAGLGLALPALYVALTSIVFESGENMRYKFFVEPLLVVFLWSQAAGALAGWARRRAA